MSRLINQAFEYVVDIGDHVRSGHYDLLDPDHQIILPILWDATIQPGWAVQQEMWPVPETETKPEPEPEPAPRLLPDTVGLDEPLGVDPKKKKPRAKPHTTGGFSSWMPGETKPKPKPKSKKKQSPALPLGSTEQQPAPDVARIADYKHKETKGTGNLTDEIREGVPPSDDDKKAVAYYYLTKWTTGWESARDKDERRSQDDKIVEVIEDE